MIVTVVTSTAAGATVASSTRGMASGCEKGEAPTVVETFTITSTVPSKRAASSV